MKNNLKELYNNSTVECYKELLHYTLGSYNIVASFNDEEMFTGSYERSFKINGVITNYDGRQFGFNLTTIVNEDEDIQDINILIVDGVFGEWHGIGVLNELGYTLQNLLGNG